MRQRARGTTWATWTERRTLLAALTAVVMLGVLAVVSIWAVLGNSQRVQRVRLGDFRQSPQAPLRQAGAPDPD